MPYLLAYLLTYLLTNLLTSSISGDGDGVWDAIENHNYAIACFVVRKGVRAKYSRYKPITTFKKGRLHQAKKGNHIHSQTPRDHIYSKVIQFNKFIPISLPSFLPSPYTHAYGGGGGGGCSVQFSISKAWCVCDLLPIWTYIHNREISTC